jgi:hypothetical protein
MTIADSDLSAIVRDARAARSIAGKLMTVPILHSPALTAGYRNSAPAGDLKRARLTVR